MLGLVFLHGGALGAPMYHFGADPPELGIGGNDTAPVIPELPSTGGGDDANITFVKETLVHLQVDPPRTLDLVDFAAIHGVGLSVQSVLESVARFFQDMVFPSYPTPAERGSVA